MSEQRFEYRIQRILEAKRFLVINVRMPVRGGQSFDLVAIKNGMAFPLEVKGLRKVKKGNKIYKYLGTYKKEQKEKQMKIAVDCNTGFHLINQLPKIGKMRLTAFDQMRLQWFTPTFGLAYNPLYNALKEFLE